MHTGFWWGNLREGDHLEDLGADGRSVLKWIFWVGVGDIDWIDLTQDRGRWQVLVTALMNLWVL